MTEKKLALISCWDKKGLVDFAKKLEEQGFEFISTGGTAKTLIEAGFKVKQVEELTNSPEMLDGRVKTLHPKIHAGLLARTENKEHMNQLKEQGIEPISLVVVNLYPFSDFVKNNPNASLNEAIEFIDIGGPTMIRAAAKNFESVAVIVSPNQYSEAIEELEKNNGNFSKEFRKKLAGKVFEHTAAYDVEIDNYLAEKIIGKDKLNLSFEKVMSLRYGENPHQEGAFYRNPKTTEPCVANVETIYAQKELSYNNIADADAAIELCKEFEAPCAVIIKHGNPCGIATGSTIKEAFEKALETDKTSAFGSIIALNRVCDEETATKIASFFNEVIIAPEYTGKAVDFLKKQKTRRILKLKELGQLFESNGLELKKVVGGLLVQDRDYDDVTKKNIKIVSKEEPTGQEINDLMFAWKVAKHVKSNAIVLVKNNATVGVGAGQMSRIDSTEIAIKKANGREKGSVLASDAFFPFRDNVDLAAKSGITAIIQPGGSVKDNEVIDAVNEHGIKMVFTNKRHFRH